MSSVWIYSVECSKNKEKWIEWTSVFKILTGSVYAPNIKLFVSMAIQTVWGVLRGYKYALVCAVIAKTFNAAASQVFQQNIVKLLLLWLLTTGIND